MLKHHLRTLSLAVLCFLLVLLCRGMYSASAATPARAECVVEVSSRRVLSSRNAQTPLPNASTTKIVTAIVILDDCAPDAVVEISDQAVGVEGSSIYLRAGEVNDAAVALALFHSGSIEKFSLEMNQKAAMLGATDSHFVNPHGLPDTRHKTTARDLALIAAYAMQTETFRTIVSTEYYAPRGWQNKN